jgi:hypothetical protein
VIPAPADALPALEAALPGAVVSPVGVFVPERMSSGARMENIASEEGACEVYSSNGSGTEARICSREGSELVGGKISICV